MTLSDIPILRLLNQQISQTKFKRVKDLVGWMGAMQAQDYDMAKWALGLRIENSTDKSIEAAINNGEIIRTHALRPTWHFVSPDDIYWLLVLSAMQIRNSMKSRDNDLGITESVYTKAKSVLEKSLAGGKQLSRDELELEFAKEKISTENGRIYHLLVRAEVDGLICNGEINDKQHTYALLEERFPRKVTLSRDEALARLAQKYFTSHGPATLHDFTWWSDLLASESRKALEIAKSKLVTENINNQVYWFADSLTDSIPDEKSIRILPAFDEFIISYKDRTACLPHQNHTKAVSSNGIFRPVIVDNGQVIGIWKRTVKKERVMVTTEFFQTPDKAALKMMEKAFSAFGHFLGKEIKGR